MLGLRVFLLLVATLLAASAEAAIYKCVHPDGRVEFTDSHCKGGKRVDLPGGGGATSTPSRSSGGGQSKGNAGPSDFPRIDRETQRRRDDLRVRVLEQEIASERDQAKEARAQLDAGQKLLPGERQDTAYRERLERLREAVERHERNITAIQRELDNLR